MADYGLKRIDYIENFMSAADWNVAISRFLAASGRQAAEVLVGKSARATVNSNREESKLAARLIMAQKKKAIELPPVHVESLTR